MRPFYAHYRVAALAIPLPKTTIFRLTCGEGAAEMTPAGMNTWILERTGDVPYFELYLISPNYLLSALA